MTGSTLAAAALPIGTDMDVSTSGTYLYVFNQQNGSDISQSPWFENTWATESLIGKRDVQEWNMHEVDVVARLPRSGDVSPLDASLKQEVFRNSKVQRGVDWSSSIYNALGPHLSGWKRSGIGR